MTVISTGWSEVESQICEMKRAGVTTAEIALHVGWGLEAIRRVLKKHGIKTNPFGLSLIWTAEEEAAIDGATTPHEAIVRYRAAMGERARRTDDAIRHKRLTMIRDAARKGSR
ncbi:MAG: hypothetical protein GXY82_00885 [Methanospirillum sp.]|nr:hypothetical protein [Methanospirillum sp.]